MESNILLKMDYDRGYVGVKTVDRPHHGSIRFLFADRLLSRVLNDAEEKSAFDADCGNFAEIWCRKGMLNFRFVWLSSYPDASVRGFVQLVSAPEEMVAGLLDTHAPLRYLYKPPPRSASIDASRAQATLLRILRHKRIKRAFSKAMRDCFQWPGEEITLMNDGNYNFYFVTKSGFPRNGGLILSEASRQGHHCFYYSVHT